MATTMKRRIERDLFFLGGMAVGARLMYMLDPDRGRRRRAMARDRATWAFHQVQRTLDRSLRDLANRAKGVAAEVISDLVPEEVPDEILVDRVRAKLGRATSHPGAIDAAVKDGVVTLKGAILEEELTNLLWAVRSVRGVRGVQHKLTGHTRADVPDLQGAGHAFGAPFELLRPNWKPATRMLVGSAGMGLAAYGLLYRRDIPGALLGLFGLGAMVRSAINERIVPLPGITDERHGINLQKTVHFRIPVEQVFALLAEPTKFPDIMSHVQEVRPIADKRHHWTIAGPLGTTLSWESEIVNHIPNRLIEWRSLPGAAVDNRGVIQFAPDENGGCRVHIRMAYFPPTGIFAHKLAEMFGADPKAVLDQDIVRLKGLLEHGKTHVRHKEITLEQVAG